MNKEELIAFEKDIADIYSTGAIRYPIHLSGGNEDHLIGIFRDFKQGDWCFSTWRSHYHALLAGIPPEKVKAKILEGRSMTLCWPEHNFFSSAIFAGCLPIAVGAAWAIKQREGSEKVWIFIGDMCALSGAAAECSRYAQGHDLPLRIVVENNGKSVCTPTMETWGCPGIEHITSEVYEYNYELPFPHAGAGKRIQF